jgi:glycosyltransferase involved in cell wall biosynthesis
MKRVLIRGPLLSISGYGTHARQIFRWLEGYKDVHITSQITPWGITPWLINPDLHDGLIGRIMATSAPIENRFDVTFQIQLPNEWDPSLGNYNVGVSAVVETTACHPQWVECCNKMSHVVVPSQHIANCVKNTANLLTPLSVIPESFYDCLSEENPSVRADLNLNTDFNFLIFGQITGNNPWSDRKNTYFAIKWLCELFASDPNIGIVIKTNHGTNSSIDKRITRHMLKQLLAEVRTGPYPKFHLLHGHMSEQEMFSVYRDSKIKALVAPTRGEGYGLPILEAAVAGLPVIATNWSGHLDFMNKGKFIQLDYDLNEVHESKIDNQIFVKGSKWADVKEKDFKRKVLKFREKNSLPKEWAKNLSSILKQSHSQKSIEKIYHGVFGDTLE